MITGGYRFVFNITPLSTVLNLVLLLIGLFALPEVFHMYGPIRPFYGGT